MLVELIEYHDGEAAARDTVRNYLVAAERHVTGLRPSPAGGRPTWISTFRRCAGYTGMGLGKPEG